MATSKIVLVPSAMLLAVVLSVSTQAVGEAFGEPIAGEAVVEVPNSCCPEGYECTPVAPHAEDDLVGATDETAAGAAEAKDDDDAPGCHGVVTCTFFVGGHLIALPFRLLSAIVRVLV